jgi:phosphinothricin acetyltransferase
MIIRHATKTDLPTIVEVYNAVVPSRMAIADLEAVSMDSRMAWVSRTSTLTTSSMDH